MKKLLASMVATVVAGTTFANDLPQQSSPWFQDAQNVLMQKMETPRLRGQAKNVILFVADGNGVSSNTAIRIFEGQAQGLLGEEHELSFEKFPHLALAKTYNSNAQTPDSAGTATAMLAGVKTRQGVVGITDNVDRGDCVTALDNQIPSALHLAERKGKATGVVSTARVTHATPAAAYAFAADRNFEDDSALSDEQKAAGCVDIASQALTADMEVILGGGRRHFIPAELTDEEGKTGRRTDGRDLTKEWQAQGGEYVWNRDGLMKLDPNADRVLGLFESSHMEYEADREGDAGGEPSLAEMTAAAINVLNKDEDGFFLLVESGRVDHAHHAGNAYRAMMDGVAFAEAVQIATQMTNLEDTLIIVTADHSHTLVMQGYAQRGNPILGLSKGLDSQGNPVTEPSLAKDGKPYTTIAYVNGPGAVQGERQDLSNVDVEDMDFVQQALIPMSSETHTAEDVAIYARGPWAWLIDGTVEQNYIFHVMDHAAGLSQ
ncbi:alkaline phosphatase [Salinibius halmophilus]|uniref:alkaline phosphatase n=1 Tax=Salinibius halmophilus TaxID=1853216 RepID=UPI000E669BCB|nr:alkaline phosphatase [Salinibius halmophilus]